MKSDETVSSLIERAMCHSAVIRTLLRKKPSRAVLLGKLASEALLPERIHIHGWLPLRCAVSCAFFRLKAAIALVRAMPHLGRGRASW